MTLGRVPIITMPKLTLVFYVELNVEFYIFLNNNYNLMDQLATTQLTCNLGLCFKILFSCRNPIFGFTTKAKACEVAGQEGSPEVTSHAPGNAKECERMNPHIPKWTPILGIGVPRGSWIFRGRLQRSNPIGLNISLYHWKSIKT
jgi:hypothetical protein